MPQINRNCDRCGCYFHAFGGPPGGECFAHEIIIKTGYYHDQLSRIDEARRISEPLCGMTLMIGQRPSHYNSISTP